MAVAGFMIQKPVKTLIVYKVKIGCSKNKIRPLQRRTFNTTVAGRAGAHLRCSAIHRLAEADFNIGIIDTAL
jgi:hypothetical protein